MGGHCLLSLTKPILLLPLLVMVVMVMLVLAAQCSEGQVDDFSHIPFEVLERLKTRSVSLSSNSYRFDFIANGSQRYPDHIRFLTVKEVSLCHCRHRCLAELRCLGYEHQGSSGTCGLTDILMPSDIKKETEGDWSTGRRRGISWLGQPCHHDRDCSLFVSETKDVECGRNKTCS